MCVGVVLGIVATLSSKVDGTYLSSGNGLSFEPRGEGKLLYNGIMKLALHNVKFYLIIYLFTTSIFISYLRR